MTASGYPRVSAATEGGTTTEGDSSLPSNA
jgi:hypothetical protein